MLFLENLALYNTKGEVPDDDIPAEIGRPPSPGRARDLTLIGYSRMAHVAAEVAAQLAESDGLDIEVVDLRSLRPLDRETIVESVRKTHAAVVARRRLADLRDRRGDRGVDLRRRLRLPGRAGPPGRDGRGADALREAAGDRGAAVAR